MKTSWLPQQVRHAEDLGVTPTDASFLISYLSVASTVGRLFFGKMADLSCVNRIRMNQLCVFAIGLCSFLVPLATGYGGLMAYAIGFGFFEACFVLLIPLVTSDIVGVEKMSYALGSAFTVMAFPMFLGPPIAGSCYLFNQPSLRTAVRGKRSCGCGFLSKKMYEKLLVLPLHRYAYIKLVHTKRRDRSRKRLIFQTFCWSKT